MLFVAAIVEVVVVVAKIGGEIVRVIDDVVEVEIDLAFAAIDIELVVVVVE
jgi:hypothetical protein